MSANHESSHGEADVDAAGSSSAGVNRRSLLAKGAVAGGLVWVAPTINVGAAAAAGCIPKCAAANFTLGVSAVDVCLPSAVYGDTGSANKAAEITISLTGTVTCPCSGGNAVVVLGAIPVDWDKVLSCPGSYSTSQVNAKKKPGTTNTFLLYKSGAMGSGVYVPNGNVCVSALCQDRSGNNVYKRCTFQICLTYSPAGSCNPPQVSTISIQAVLVGSCTTSCDPCS